MPTNSQTNTKAVYKTLLLFLFFIGVFSNIWYYAIFKLNPTSIYVGALMLSPALAAFVTLKIKGRALSSLPWGLKKLKYLRFSYFIPVLYIALAYALIWVFGFGTLFHETTLQEWAATLGLEHSSTPLMIGVMVFLLATVGVVKNLGSTLGEEIGWRGFFIFELRKVFSLKALP